MHAMTAEECREWLQVEPGAEPQALIFMGALDYPQALDAWSRALTDVHRGPFPNVLFGSALGLRLAVGVGYGAAIAGDVAHACCLLGARTTLVTGYFGGLQPGIRFGDVLIATRATPLDSVAPHYLGRDERVEASEDVVRWLKERCQKEQLSFHLGPLVSAPSIMTETEEHFRDWQAGGFYGVDLEVAVVFAVARRFGARRGALLVQSDSPIEGVYVATRRSETERDLMLRRQFQIGTIALRAALEFSAAS